MSESKSQNYLHGAALLTAGTIVIKILGFIYKVPLGTLLSDEGYAHFLVAYNIYNVFLTISVGGLPVALSRMVSEAETLGRYNQVRRIYRVSFITFFLLGLVCSLVMLLFPVSLANAMSDVEAAQSILAMSPSVLLVCVMAAYRGYAQGRKNMVPTTVSQIIEVLVKVAVGLVLTVMLIRAGKSLPIASAGAILGTTFGSLAALLYIGFYVRRAYHPNALAPSADVPDSSGRVLGNLLKIGIPIAIGSGVLSIVSLIDSKLCLSRLQDAAGFTFAEAKVLFGVYGKAMTLYNLPSAFITPMTIAIMPAIAACIAKKQHDDACEIAESSMRISTVLVLPMCVGMAVLAYPIMNVLYPGSSYQGPALLAVMAIAGYFVCIALLTCSILQAYGNERLPVYSMIIGGLVKVGMNYFLIGTPSINIYGAPYGTLCCYLVIAVINLVFASRKMSRAPNIGRIILRPAVSCAAMGAAAWGVYGLAARVLAGGGELGRIKMAVAMCAAIAVAVVVYLVLIIALRAVTMDDMKLIPKGEKIARLLHIR